MLQLSHVDQLQIQLHIFNENGISFVPETLTLVNSRYFKRAEIVAPK
jgi:hypothetical protein